MGISAKDRVFVCDIRQYGNVSRTNILGFSKSGSYVVTCDNGKQMMYVGDKTKHVVCSQSSENDIGEKFLLPIDLKTIGLEIMKDNDVTPINRSKILEGFSKLSDEEHGYYRTEYSKVASDKTKTKKFVMSICNKFI